VIKTKIFHKSNINTRKDFVKSMKIFEGIVAYMKEDEIQSKLKETHRLGAKSSEIQEIIMAKTIILGFSSEKKGLFENHSVSQLRPDYYLELEENKGIILEVERGKTIDNNMDLLDLWKCHICSSANYLFLIVPNITQKGSGGRNIIFDTVERRMETFFKTENYTNVDGIFIIGY
jgi:hypothetical protein